MFVCVYERERERGRMQGPKKIGIYYKIDDVSSFLRPRRSNERGWGRITA